MRILITGGTGTLGRFLQKELAVAATTSSSSTSHDGPEEVGFSLRTDVREPR
jgi:uncharacterized protein YbjT (DUF2867 family)